MRVLIAGAGKTARELLRRIGQSWQVTLADANEFLFDNFKNCPQVVSLVSGDISSRVVLDKACLGIQDFVVAVTNRDEVNLEVCRYARKLGIPNVIALVNDSLQLPAFRDLGVRTICGSQLVARDVELFLETPRLFVTTIADGAGEVMEVQVVRRAPAVGRPIRELGAKDWLIAAIHRDGQLIIPHGDTVIRARDRLTIVGRSDLYRSLAHFFSLEDHCFPLEYGQQVLLPVAGDENGLAEVMDEAAYLVTNTRAQGLFLLSAEELPEPVRSSLARLEGTLRIAAQTMAGPIRETLVQATKSLSVGCVVSPAKPLGPLARLLGIPTVIALAHRLSCPMLVSRQTMPYRRLLVPCSGTHSTGLALETAIDLARQLGAEVDTVTVADPLALTGQGSKEWVEEALGQAREISQLHHFSLGEIVREGNVIKEIAALAADYDLLVLGSTTQSASLLQPHIGERLVQDVPCSVLVVT